MADLEGVNAKSNAGLTTGIIGTAGFGLSLLSGLIGGVGGNGIMGHNFATQENLNYSQALASKDSEIALLKSESNTESKMIEVYKQAHEEIAKLRDTVYANQQSQQAWNSQQSVINAQMSAAVATNANSIASLQSLIGGLTKTVIPSDNVCPKPMAMYNSWTAPTTATTATGTGSN